MNILEKAILNENVEDIKSILNNENKAINEVGSNGVALSLLAGKTGNIEIVKYIVEYSMASMNITDNNNKNMLHYGAMSGSLEVCKYLVERVGLSPLTGDCDLITPFEIAHNNKFLDVEKYFESVIGSKFKDMYKNPIRKGFYPDPSIVRVGEDYYMVNSSFIYFPCIPISHSKDLVNWHIIGFAITNAEWANIDDLEGGRGYWAPDISYYKGRFYITATYRLNDNGTVYRKQIIVSAEKAEGPYSKPIFINEDGIDPSIFNDDDGRRYMLLNRGARILELNSEATMQISEAKLLFYGDNKRASEGPHLLKKDGYYYLFQAEGGTGLGHRVTVSRSKSLMGNYEPCPYNPILIQKDPKGKIQRCGHGKPVQTQNGQWYMVYLCGRGLEGENGECYSILGRETALDPINWTSDGWPIVNNLKGPSALQIKPDLKEVKFEEEENGFSEDTLFNNWMFPRTPEKDGYFIKNSTLFLKGSKEDLYSIKARNILLRRQESFNFTTECKMSVPRLKVNQNAGMVCYYDENTYIKFALFKGENNYYIGVRERIGKNDIIHKGFEINECDYIYFKIVVQGLKRIFYFSYNGVDFIKCCELENVYYLCDEGIKMGKRFTGAMIGVYGFSGQDDMFIGFERFSIIF